MDRQQIFNTAYLGLKAQGFERSVMSGEPEDGCFYRGPNGLKCALGHCIPDELYSADMEGDSPFSEDGRRFSFLEPSSFADLTFLANLQTVHDNARSPEDMASRLADFAVFNSLSVPE